VLAEVTDSAWAAEEAGMYASRFSCSRGCWISVQKLLMFLMDAAVMLGNWNSLVCAEATSPQGSTSPFNMNILAWAVGVLGRARNRVVSA